MKIYLIVALAGAALVTSAAGVTAEGDALAALTTQLKALRALPAGTDARAACPVDVKSILGTPLAALSKSLGDPDYFVDGHNENPPLPYSIWSYFLKGPSPVVPRAEPAYPIVVFHVGAGDKVESAECSMSRVVAAAPKGPDPAVLSYRLPKDFDWKVSREYPGLKSAVLWGDPSKPGPYTVVNRFEPGAFSHPHFHPNDRYIVVLSGTWWVGTGEKFDPESTTPVPAGTFAVHYAGKVHYDGARNEPCVVMISGIGPATSTRVGVN